MPIRPSCPRPVFETMEPRILHSADLAPLLVADATDGASLQQQIQQAGTDATTRSNEIAFVDLALPDAQVLLDDLHAQQLAGRALEIVTIASDADGLALIGDTLAGRADITAVHVLAHGSDGRLQLGNTVMDAQSLLARADLVAAWASALTADADLLMYGCDFAQTGVGQQLVRDLAMLTGADVAASTDLTGAAARWQLDARIQLWPGRILGRHRHCDPAELGLHIGRQLRRPKLGRGVRCCRQFQLFAQRQRQRRPPAFGPDRER